MLSQNFIKLTVITPPAWISILLTSQLRRRMQIIIFVQTERIVSSTTSRSTSKFLIYFGITHVSPDHKNANVQLLITWLILIISPVAWHLNFVTFLEWAQSWSRNAFATCSPDESFSGMNKTSIPLECIFWYPPSSKVAFGLTHPTSRLLNPVIWNK